jgi:hypothetical protein
MFFGPHCRSKCIEVAGRFLHQFHGALEKFGQAEIVEEILLLSTNDPIIAALCGTTARVNITVEQGKHETEKACRELCALAQAYASKLEEFKTITEAHASALWQQLACPDTATTCKRTAHDLIAAAQWEVEWQTFAWKEDLKHRCRPFALARSWFLSQTSEVRWEGSVLQATLLISV